MNTPYTVYDPASGRVTATGEVRGGGWSVNVPPGQAILFGQAATKNDRVDVGAGVIVGRSPLLLQALYSVAVGGSIVFVLPVPCDIRYDDAVVGTLAAGGDSILFPTAGMFGLTISDPSGLYLDTNITITVS